MLCPPLVPVFKNPQLFGVYLARPLDVILLCHLLVLWETFTVISVSPYLVRLMKKIDLSSRLIV